MSNDPKKNENSGESASSFNTKKVQLKDHGPQLTLGTIDTDGSYVKSLDVRKWRMKEERELGELRDQNRESSVANFVAMVLATMCTRIGIYDFDKMKFEEKLVHVSQMFVGDVFYAYVWLRLQTLGNKLHLDMKCPSCKFQFPFVADINTIEVDVCESLDDAMWVYNLEEPFEVRGKEVKGLLMGPPRWSSLESMKGVGGLNTGGAKAGLILGSIYGIDNWKGEDGKSTKLVLAPHELDEMVKGDIEGITNKLDGKSLGPDLSIEGSCPRCHNPYTLSIDWGYDNFFGDSSR